MAWECKKTKKPLTLLIEQIEFSVAVNITSSLCCFNGTFLTLTMLQTMARGALSKLRSGVFKQLLLNLSMVMVAHRLLLQPEKTLNLDRNRKNLNVCIFSLIVSPCLI